MAYNGPLPQVVNAGGTGIATTTAYAPICGGTSSTGNLQAASTGIGTSGYVLTSNGNAALPSFQVSAGTTTFDADTGSATPSAGVININAVDALHGTPSTFFSTSASGNTIQIACPLPVYNRGGTSFPAQTMGAVVVNGVPPAYGSLTFIPLFISLKTVVSNTYAAPATVSIGTNSPNYDNIVGSTVLSASLGTVGNYYTFSLTSGVSLTPGASVYANVTVAATAVNQAIDVAMVGIYN